MRLYVRPTQSLTSWNGSARVATFVHYVSVSSRASIASLLRSAPLRSARLAPLRFAPLRPLAVLRSRPSSQELNLTNLNPSISLLKNSPTHHTLLMQLEGDTSRHLLRPGFEVGQKDESGIFESITGTSVKEQVFR